MAHIIKETTVTNVTNVTRTSPVAPGSKSKGIHQPWRYSTGPRTPAGKAIVSQNACKALEHKRPWQQYRSVIGELQAYGRWLALVKKRWGSE